MKLTIASRLLLVLISLSEVRGEDGDDLAKEIIETQEQFLSAISPRPTGDDLSESPLYPELVRRISLINKNWIHQQKGIEDAAKHKLSVIKLPGASDVDKAYLVLLEKELGIESKTLPEGLKGDAARFYAHGFNSRQLEILKKKIGEPKLEDLVYRACVSLGYKSTSNTSLLFVPWRFSQEFQPAIRGLAQIPHR